jgi:hypothetical protein
LLIALDNSGLEPYQVNSPLVTIDGTAPAISGLTVTQIQPGAGSVNVLNGAVAAIQSAPMAVGFTVTDNLAGVDPLDGGTTIEVLLGDTLQMGWTVTAVDTSVPTLSYEVTAPVGAASGTYTLRITSADRCRNQAVQTGTIKLARELYGSVTFTGVWVGGSFMRTAAVDGGATFAATNSSGVVLKRWSGVTLVFSPTVPRSGLAQYRLQGVPEGTARLSVKFHGVLRKRLSVPAGTEATLVDFTGAAALRGGDLSGPQLLVPDNKVNNYDYNILSQYWLKTNWRGDITGDNKVNQPDYDIMSANWFRAGDPE